MSFEINPEEKSITGTDSHSNPDKNHYTQFENVEGIRIRNSITIAGNFTPQGLHSLLPNESVQSLASGMSINTNRGLYSNRDQRQYPRVYEQFKNSKNVMVENSRFYAGNVDLIEGSCSTEQQTVDGNINASVVGCWMSADNVAKHIMNILPQVESVMSTHRILPHQYAIFCGFDESLIRKGVGYLQQAHVISSVDVDEVSPLFTQLGKLFSPYSAQLFTPSARTRLPVFKEDGTKWDFDELTFTTASKIIDHGSSGTAHPAMISFGTGRHSRRINEYKGSSSSKRHTNKKTSKGEGRDEKGDRTNNNSRRKKESGQDEDAGKGNSGSEEDGGDDLRGGRDPDGVGEEQNPLGDGNTSTGPHLISFSVVSNLCSIHSPQPFQHIKCEGEISFQMDKTGISNVYQVDFKRSKVVSVPSSNIAFEQYHLQITMNSRRENAKMVDIRPQHTLTFEKESKITSGSKASWNAGAGFSVGVLPHPKVSLSATGTHAAERSQGSEQKQYSSRIYETDIFGAVWWNFNVDDPTERRDGIRIAEGNLPSTKFQCRSDTSTDPLDVEVASYWSIIPADSSSNMDWIPRILSKNTDKSRIFYSNLAEFVVVTIPQDIEGDSGYIATMKVNDGPQSLYVSDLQVKEQYGEVVVASAVSGKGCNSDFGNGNGRLGSMLRLPSLHNLAYSTELSLGSHSSVHALGCDKMSSPDSPSEHGGPDSPHPALESPVNDTGIKGKKPGLGSWMLDELRSYW